MFCVLSGCGTAKAVPAAFFRGDFSVSGSDPPPEYWRVPGGSCGEACLWTILRKKGIRRTQEQINRDGLAPGRGLHSGELFRVLKRHRIRYRNVSGNVRYIRGYILRSILPQLQRGRLVLLGVKTYPDAMPHWAVNHFILLTGFNLKRRELLFNSDTEKGRIAFRSLQTVSAGLSLVNRQKYVFAIAIL